MDATIEFLKAKNGMPTARVHATDGTSFMLHSAYDPVAEARRLLEKYPSLKDAGVVVVLGLGLGYHVCELLRIVPTKAFVLVIEADPELRRRFEKSADIPWNRVNVTKDESAIWALISQAREQLRDGFVIVEHPASQRLNPAFYRYIRHRVRDFVSMLLVETATAKRLNRFIQENMLRNLPNVTVDPGINVLENVFRGRPAVIVAAGPSLTKNIHLLKMAKERSIVISVGTALKAILSQSVHPDLVVTLDPLESNYRHFADLDFTQAFLCYEPQTYYKIPQLFGGRRFVFNSFWSNMSVWLTTLFGNKGYIEPGGSVAVAAFGLACLLGANPIVFIGQDLAYTDGLTHADGTIYEGQKVAIDVQRLDYLEVPAVGGATVFTSRALYTVLVRFEELFAEHKDRLIIDATEGGALKRGTVVMSFREAIDRYFTEEFPVLPVIEECHRRHRPDPAVRERVRDELEKTAREYGDFIPKLEEILSLANRVQELNDLAENMGRREATPGFARSTLEALKKKGEELNELLKEVNAQAKLVDLLSLLTFDVQLMPPLAEDAPLAEQLGRIKQVYSLYLEAAKTTRRQMEEAAAALRGS